MTTAAPIEKSIIKVSPILAMARRAAELRAAGKDIVDLTLGEPDFAPPSHVADAAIDAARRPTASLRCVLPPVRRLRVIVVLTTRTLKSLSAVAPSR